MKWYQIIMKWCQTSNIMVWYDIQYNWFEERIHPKFISVNSGGEISLTMTRD